MKKNEIVFLPGNEILPKLYIDMVFVEEKSPILFTCIDEFDDMYLCSCHRSDSEKKEWIIVRTPPENVLDLLTDRITIQSAIISCEDIYIATLSNGIPAPQISRTKIDKISPDILPTAGYYMEADDHEFDDEIEVLRRRIESKILRTKYHITFYMKQFTQKIDLIGISPIRNIDPQSGDVISTYNYRLAMN